MKALGVVFLVLLLLVGIGVYAGWLGFSSTEDSANIEVRTQEIESAVDRGVEETQQAVDTIGDGV